MRVPARLDLVRHRERREIESAFDKQKTHLRVRPTTLRSRTPDPAREAFCSLVMAHSALRGPVRPPSPVGRSATPG